MTGILLIDNHPLFRATVEQYLQHCGDGNVRVVGLSAGQDVLPVALAVHPEIVLVDIGHVLSADLAMLRELRMILPHAALVAMSWEENTAIHQEACAAGADTFLLKDRLNTMLLPTVQALIGVTSAKQSGRETRHQVLF